MVIPCYNEEKTLGVCVGKVLDIAHDDLQLEIIIVDDCSADKSAAIAQDLVKKHPEVHYFKHTVNQGKGAALRTGFAKATGDYVAVQDADLEYDPQDLLRLLEPLISQKADVVLGSRFLTTGAHRVFYFWHSMGNKFLTFLSNMLTDLNLTDMETCYKVFRREVIQSIEIEENRFGFEPEIVAKIAQRRLKIYEMGISYDGRTYADGKKIGAKDGFRAIYCIMRYNGHKAPVAIQLLIYTLIALCCTIINLGAYHLAGKAGLHQNLAITSSFALAALASYFLSLAILFRHQTRWKAAMECLLFVICAAVIGAVDFGITLGMAHYGNSLCVSKLVAIAVSLALIFFVSRGILFPERNIGPWRT